MTIASSPQTQNSKLTAHLQAAGKVLAQFYCNKDC
jgi:hypothetical protein